MRSPVVLVGIAMPPVFFILGVLLSLAKKTVGHRLEDPSYIVITLFNQAPRQGRREEEEQ